jgi:hypothetical protein
MKAGKLEAGFNLTNKPKADIIYTQAKRRENT